MENTKSKEKSEFFFFFLNGKGSKLSVNITNKF